MVKTNTGNTVVATILAIAIVAFVSLGFSIAIRTSTQQDKLHAQQRTQQQQQKQQAYDNGQTVQWQIAGRLSDGSIIYRARMISEMSITTNDSKYDHWLYKTQQGDAISTNWIEPRQNGKYLQNEPMSSTTSNK